MNKPAATMTKKQMMTIYHNVDSFLKHDYPIIYRRSGDWGITRINMDGMPKAVNKQNANERLMIEHSAYSLANAAVLEAVKGCSKESQLIIDGRYFKQLTNYQLKCKIGIYGNSSLYRRLYKACLEYADCLETVCAKLNVDSDIIPKLNTI